MYNSIDLFWYALLACIMGGCLVFLWVREWVSPKQLALKFISISSYQQLASSLELAKENLATLNVELNGARLRLDHASAQNKSLEQALEKERAGSVSVSTLQKAAEQEIIRLSSELEHLKQRLAFQADQFAEIRRQTKEEFSTISSSLLQSNSTALREDHERSLYNLLNPLRIKLSEFQTQVDQKFSEESKDKAALKAQIEQLTTLNQDLSHEARQLTKALKGDSKAQGDWGELQLERLLEAAGLQADTHFDTQTSFKSETGLQQRPDCIVKLPLGRCIVIDSKVSLTAYERYCSSDEDGAGIIHLREHVASLRAHIKGLSAKRYQELYQINCPDYVLLFVPLEPAFIAAVRERPNLFTEALSANVVLVSPSTLLATMRTVAFIWQQEDQRENAQKIAEVGKKLYEKFVGFVEDMDNVGSQLDKAKNSYDDAMLKLSKSPQRSTTLLARANELRALGVSSTKELSS